MIHNNNKITQAIRTAPDITLTQKNGSEVLGFNDTLMR